MKKIIISYVMVSCIALNAAYVPALTQDDIKAATKEIKILLNKQNIWKKQSKGNAALNKNLWTMIQESKLDQKIDKTTIENFFNELNIWGDDLHGHFVTKLTREQFEPIAEYLESLYIEKDMLHTIQETKNDINTTLNSMQNQVKEAVKTKDLPTITTKVNKIAQDAQEAIVAEAKEIPTAAKGIAKQEQSFMSSLFQMIKNIFSKK